MGNFIDKPAKSGKTVESIGQNTLVTAIVSTFNCERFMRGCLQNLEDQTMRDRLEIIVVDSGSEQNERAIVEEFRRQYDNTRYIRTNRESIYASWNRAINMARGKYITNANTDDRHRRDALEIMALALDANPDVGLLYADTLVTLRENETFENNSAEYLVSRPDYSLRQALIFCPYGPQPMWRRSAHEKVGMFDDRMVVAGDYDFFLRLSWSLGALHLRDTLGLYLANPKSVERANAAAAAREIFGILRYFRNKIPLEDIYPGLRLKAAADDRLARIACLLDFGNCCLRSDWPIPMEAIMFYTQAIQLAGPIPSIMSNLAVAMYLGGRHESSMQLLHKLKQNLSMARANLELLEAHEKEAEGGGNRALLRLYDIDHTAVTSAVRGLGLVRQKWGYALTESHETYWSARETTAGADHGAR